MNDLEFWQAVYIASISAGRDFTVAKITADLAVQALIAFKTKEAAK